LAICLILAELFCIKFLYHSNRGQSDVNFNIGVKAYFHYLCTLRCVALRASERLVTSAMKRFKVHQSSSRRFIALTIARHATQRAAVMEIGP